MRLVFCLVATVALCASASASVDFWFTSSAEPYGLVDPTKAFVATGTNGTDYLDGWRLANNVVPPPATSDVVIDCAQPDPAWAYIWARFNNEPLDAQINGIALEIVGAGSGQGNIAWYKGENGADHVTPGGPWCRWDGDLDVFYFNPAGLIAIRANGIRNFAGDHLINMYVGGNDHTFLLGAVRCDECPDELSFGFGVTPIHYGANPPLPNPDANGLNKVVCVPEPGGLLLLSLIGLLVRRR